MLFIRQLLFLAALLAVDIPASGADKEIAIDDSHLLLSPYVWKQTGSGQNRRMEAVMPGAYLKARFQSSGRLGLRIDGTGNKDCPPESMPVIEFSVNHGPFQIVPLTKTAEVYTLPLADKLDPAKTHELELVFRASDLTLERWTSPKTHLRLAGLVLDHNGTLLPLTRRPRNAIAFGDSITEGVGAEGLFTSWQKLQPNSARVTWFPLVCAALDCEYGQLGSGGQGISRQIHLPPLTKTWDRHEESTSRLVDGKLMPEPDFIFCEMGTNDYDKVITTDYITWLTEMRKACPHSRFFCIVPTLGVHREEIVAAIAERHKAGDRRVYLVETKGLKETFRVSQETETAYDGVHPSVYGHARLGSLIAVEVQKTLSAEKQP
ncbi:MAG: GDSL-type esterase/lipase family protein [Planctomycetales bacterium]